MRPSILFLVPLLAACAPKPQIYAESLPSDDPKWKTPECVSIREKAFGYDDKVAERAVGGLALGLVLGPFGIPFAVAADASQNEDRRSFAREVHMRCSSKPLPEKLKTPDEQKKDLEAKG
jgi:hypothetical protein